MVTVEVHIISPNCNRDNDNGNVGVYTAERGALPICGGISCSDSDPDN